jgi:hypothetical protein
MHADMVVAVGRAFECRGLATQSVGPDVTANLVHSILLCGWYPWSLSGDPLPPYFGSKVSRFLEIRWVYRCKVFITKEFFAKSSSVRSYGRIIALEHDGYEVFLRMIVQRAGEMICKPRRGVGE